MLVIIASFSLLKHCFFAMAAMHFHLIKDAHDTLDSLEIHYAYKL